MFRRILAGEQAREREACTSNPKPPDSTRGTAPEQPAARSMQTPHDLEEGSGYFKLTHYPDELPLAQQKRVCYDSLRRR